MSEPLPHFSGSSREDAYLPVWHDRETEPSPRRHFNRSSRGSRTTKAPRERERTRSATKTRRRARVRRTTRRNKNTRRALQAKRAMAERSSERQPPCWFDHDGAPLRWDVCAGILHDVFVRRDGRRRRVRRAWRLTVHYAAYRDDENDRSALGGDGSRSPGIAGSFACVEAQSCARAHFFNALKEATHIERGSAAGVMSMTRAAQTNLWRSVLTGDRRLAFEAEEAFPYLRMFRARRSARRRRTSRLIPCACTSDVLRTDDVAARRRLDVGACPSSARRRTARREKQRARDALALIAASPTESATDDGTTRFGGAPCRAWTCVWTHPARRACTRGCGARTGSCTCAPFRRRAS